MGEKWIDSRPAEKLLALYTMMLVNPDPMTLTSMANKLDCSKQTIGRLIDQLESSNFGKIVREKRGRENLYSLARPQKRPYISLNAEGLSQLALCREFLLRLLPPAMARHMENSLNQAAAFLPENSCFTSGIGASVAKGRINYAPFEKIMQTLIKAISAKRVCRVSYRRQRHLPAREYDFAPRRLVAFHESIFVQGFVVTEKGPVEKLYDNPALLSLHRFTSCNMTQRKADNLPEPETPDLSMLGLIQSKPFSFAVRFYPKSATYAAERQWSQDQTVEDLPDGSVILRATAASEAECVAWVLSFGDSCKVLEPDWFKELVMTKISNMAALYSGTT